MFATALLFSVLIALSRGDCSVAATLASAEVTASTCISTSVTQNSNSASAAGTAVCGCISAYATAAGGNCDAATLQVVGQCAAATILGDVFTAGNYDFGANCGICGNPPASPNWPTSCGICVEKFTSCVTTGTYDLVSHPQLSAVNYTLALACGCIGRFISCFSGCGSPYSSYATAYCNQATYSYCNCNGGVGVEASKILTYLQANWVLFHTYVKAISDASILTIDCATKTAAAGNTLAVGRFYCDIDFGTNTPNWALIHARISDYLGLTVTIGQGQQPAGPIVSTEKRSLQTVQTFTIQANSASTLSSFIMVAVLVLSLLI